MCLFSKYRNRGKEPGIHFRIHVFQNAYIVLDGFYWYYTETLKLSVKLDDSICLRFAVKSKHRVRRSFINPAFLLTITEQSIETNSH